MMTCQKPRVGRLSSTEPASMRLQCLSAGSTMLAPRTTDVPGELRSFTDMMPAAAGTMPPQAAGLKDFLYHDAKTMPRVWNCMLATQPCNTARKAESSN